MPSDYPGKVEWTLKGPLDAWSIVIGWFHAIVCMVVALMVAHP